MNKEVQHKPSVKKQRLKRLSMYPLTPSQALGAFMKVGPKKIRKAVR